MNLKIITDYYRRRVNEYEKIYFRDDPVRQNEQKIIADVLATVFKGRDVLEIACGTGYWTQFASEAAENIVATDYVQEVMDVAKSKKYNCSIKFQQEDAYDLSFMDMSFNGGLANFWVSHVPKEKMQSFLTEFHRVLKSGATVFLADNVHIPGFGGELIHKKEDKNTYEIRSLSDGFSTEVLKNYFTENELKKLFEPYARKNSINIFYGKCFWYVSYVKK